MATMEGISPCMCCQARHLNGPLFLKAQIASGLRLQCCNNKIQQTVLISVKNVGAQKNDIVKLLL